MKSKLLPNVWQTHPLLSARDLQSAPSESILFETMTLSVNNVESQCWLSWNSGANDGVSFFLGVLTHGSIERSNWKDSKLQGEGPSEWKPVREEFGRKQELWSVRSGDISLLRGWIASELARRPVGFPQISLPGASYGSTEGGPLNFGGQPKGQLQDAVWARLGITPAAAPERHVVSPDPSGLMLAGDVKDVDITDIMQSINMCKMTGRLTVLQTQRQVEIFFDAGELIHARSLQALYAGGIIDGDEAVLDLFTWSEGAFQFQHMWKATESSVKRKLHALLLEGATLQDYKAALAGKMIALNSTLCVNPASACLSEAEFDARLKNGIPIHQDIQKQVFLKLRKPQRLATLVSELKLSSSTWIPVVFSLSSLDLIASC